MKENIVVDVNVKVHVPKEDWIDFCLLYPDLFMFGYIGYWAFGARPNGVKDQWIVIENEEVGSLSERESLEEEAQKAFVEGKPLPEYCHILNEKAVIKAFLIGCEKWGVDWFDDADGERYDAVIQLALLEEAKYG